MVGEEFREIYTTKNFLVRYAIECHFDDFMSGVILNILHILIKYGNLSYRERYRHSSGLPMCQERLL